MPESAQLRVFLCHSSQDKPAVRELYQRLSSEGWIDPWLDEEKLLPGQEWDVEIEKAVESATAVIVCLSKGSVAKEGYIQRELKFALDIADEKPQGTIFVIPLRLDNCVLPRRLRQWQAVDFFPSDQKERAYKRLLAGMRSRFDALPGDRKSPIISREELQALGYRAKKNRDDFPVIHTQTERQSLINLANEARKRAYAPYSRYAVGAALQTKTGRVYTGVNVENAAYPHTMCAERIAVFKAVSEGELAFDSIAVVTDNGGSPCGGCRQVLSEFGLDTTVLIANGRGKLLKETTVKELLPEAFTPDNLE